MEIPNLKSIDDLAHGDLTFKAKFIQILKEEFPIEKAEYLDNMKKCRMEESANNVHKLKHKLSILGLFQDYELAIKHEEALNEGNTEYAEEFLNVLKKVEEFIINIES
ncbi:MAG: Hpt domain-containing protein [Bacteroidia bacterium]|nr:Hpt domain-containing protein [Bacteroidia bacterium]